jgi:hypothetical protein
LLAPGIGVALVLVLVLLTAAITARGRMRPTTGVRSPG